MFFNLHRVNINYLKHLFQGEGAGGKGAYTPLPIAWKGGEGGQNYDFTPFPFLENS
jgi:hypothetical protein